MNHTQIGQVVMEAVAGHRSEKCRDCGRCPIPVVASGGPITRHNINEIVDHFNHHLRAICLTIEEVTGLTPVLVLMSPSRGSAAGSRSERCDA